MCVYGSICEYVESVYVYECVSVNMRVCGCECVSISVLRVVECANVLSFNGSVFENERVCECVKCVYVRVYVRVCEFVRVCVCVCVLRFVCEYE